jgi:hypothetical protein
VKADTPPKRLGSIVAIGVIVITVALFLALRLCRHQADSVFMASSISIPSSGSSSEDNARADAIAEKELAAVRSNAKKEAHREMVALTVSALVLLFLLKRPGIPDWSKYVLTTAAAAGIAACIALW